MPELPDVEVLRRRLERDASHRRVAGVDVAAPEMLEGVSPGALKKRLEGRTLVETRRHGKYLFGKADRGGWLLLHFGMTGGLSHWRDGAPEDHVRLRLDFADGSHLAFHDTRKLGRIGWVDDVDGYVRERRLGPDALDPGMELAAFREALAARKAAVKAVLMNQEVLAGVGNVYADEILFQAGVHPEAPANELGPATVRSLHGTMRRVLKAAIDAGADPERMPDAFLLPHRRGDGRCPRCGRALKQIKVGGRTTYFCEKDQRKRK